VTSLFLSFFSLLPAIVLLPNAVLPFFSLPHSFQQPAADALSLVARPRDGVHPYSKRRFRRFLDNAANPPARRWRARHVKGCGTCRSRLNAARGHGSHRRTAGPQLIPRSQRSCQRSMATGSLQGYRRAANVLSSGPAHLQRHQRRRVVGSLTTALNQSGRFGYTGSQRGRPKIPPPRCSSASPPPLCGRARSTSSGSLTAGQRSCRRRGSRPSIPLAPAGVGDTSVSRGRTTICFQAAHTRVAREPQRCPYAAPSSIPARNR